MEVVYSKNFLKSVKLVPKNIQVKLATFLECFKNDPFNSKLHTKPLCGKLKGFFSFRITRDWRAIFRFLDKNKLHLIEIAHRKDIYK